MSHCFVGVCSSRVHCAEIGRCFSTPEPDPPTARMLTARELHDCGVCHGSGAMEQIAIAVQRKFMEVNGIAGVTGKEGVTK